MKSQRLLYTFLLSIGILYNVFAQSVTSHSNTSILPETVIADAGMDQEICELTTFLDAIPEIDAIQYWKQTTGVIFDDPADPNTTVFFENEGVYELTWVLEKDGFISEDIVIIIVDNSIQADIVEISFNTDQSQITLHANEGDIMLWTVDNSSAFVHSPSNNITVIENLSLGENLITYELGVGMCFSQDEIVVTYHEPVFAEIFTPDTLICNDFIELVANGDPIGGNGYWSIVGNTTAQILDPLSPFTMIDGLSIGENVFTWTIENEFATAIDTVIVYASFADLLPQDTFLYITEPFLEIDFNEENLVYHTFYESKLVNEPQKGTAILEDNYLTYFVDHMMLGYDTIIYQITDQCGHSAENIITLWIENNDLVSSEDVITAHAGTSITFNILDSIEIDDPYYTINNIAFTFIEPFSIFGAPAFMQENGQVTLDYTNITEIGMDSVYYEICDDTEYCLAGYLKVNVVPVVIEGSTSDVVVYNVLSPNDDDKQDYLYVENLFTSIGTLRFPDNELTIFDRWGKVVQTVKHYDNDLNRWEGNNGQGELVEKGTYYYAFRLNDDTFLSGFIIVNY